MGTHSLRRVFVPFYNLQTRLATAAGSCHRANTQAVEIIEANNVVLLFLRFHLFYNFRRYFLDLKDTSMTNARRFETHLIYEANQTVSRPLSTVYNLQSTCHAL